MEASLRYIARLCPKKGGGKERQKKERKGERERGKEKGRKERKRKRALILSKGGSPEVWLAVTTDPAFSGEETGLITSLPHLFPLLLPST